MIITIARKYGSGGREIGQRLAKHLNIPYYNVDALPHTRIEDWQEEILRLADAGPCVMVGFCADHVLAGREASCASSSTVIWSIVSSGSWRSITFPENRPSARPSTRTERGPGCMDSIPEKNGPIWTGTI